MSLKDTGKYIFGAILAAVLLWWVFRGIEPRALWDQVRRASVVGLMLCALLNAGHVVFRVWRWRALLEPVQPKIPFRPMFVACVIGYMTTWVIPGRLGELVRPMLLSAREGVALGPSIGSVVADRLLDAVTVVLLFTVGTWITPLEGPAAEHAALIRGISLVLTAAVVGVLVVMALASMSGGRLQAWLSRRHGLVRWVGTAVLSVSRGAEALRSPRLMAQVIFHSVAAWVTIVAGTWFGVRAAGAELSYGAMLVVLPMLVLGVAVPTPGGAGSYHGAMKAGLLLFGVAEIVAVGAGLLVHAAITVPIILLGILLLWTEKVSWKDLIAGAREFRKLGDGAGGPAHAAVESTP